MHTMTVLRALGPMDAKSIGRDSFLLWMAFLPILLAAVLRWGVPLLETWLQAEFEFALAPYRTLIASYLVALAVPLLVGQILGFRLLDERDDDTLRALLVTPLPLEAYLAYRIGIPLVLCTALTLVLVPFTNLVNLPWLYLLPLAGMYGLAAPMMALAMVSIAQNKVQGFAFVKAAGVVQALPVLAWFAGPPVEYLAGLLPIYWPLKAFWLAADGSSGYWIAIGVGYTFEAAVVWLLIRRFRHIARR